MTDAPGAYDGALDGPDVVDAEVIDDGRSLAIPGREVAVPEYGLDPWSEPGITAEAYDLSPGPPSSRGASGPGRQTTSDAAAAASGGGSRTGGGRSPGGAGGRGRARKGRGRGRRGGGITLLGLHIHLPTISLLSDNAVVRVGKGRTSGRGRSSSSRRSTSSRRSRTSRGTTGLHLPQRRPIHRRGMLDRILGGGR